MYIYVCVYIKTCFEVCKGILFRFENDSIKMQGGYN
jgi:hypothetical protein